MLAIAIIGMALLAAHASAALGYYAVSLRWYRKGLRVSRGDPSGLKVSVVIPTYNESKIIQAKLDDVIGQRHQGPMEVIVVDSSTDGTPELVEGWSRLRGVPVKLLREPERRGKHEAENYAVREASGDVIVFTDADCRWSKGSLSAALSYMADPSVGLVTCVKRPDGGALESTYRELYNVLRLGESSAHSTTVAHGELLAVRRQLLLSLGGLRPGADDSDLAHRVAMRGLRAIAAPDVVCTEMTPRRGYLEWRLRRAQHLIARFASSLRDLPRAPRGYREALAWESFLHLFNPWLAAAALAFLVAAALEGSIIAAAALMIVLALLLASRTARTWALEQAILVAGAIRNLWNREHVWKKVEKS